VIEKWFLPRLATCSRFAALYRGNGNGSMIENTNICEDVLRLKDRTRALKER